MLNQDDKDIERPAAKAERLVAFEQKLPSGHQTEGAKADSVIGCGVHLIRWLQLQTDPSQPLWLVAYQGGFKKVGLPRMAAFTCRDEKATSPEGARSIRQGVRNGQFLTCLAQNAAHLLVGS